MSPEISAPFVRVYVDLPRDVNTQLDEMVRAANMSKKAYIAHLIIEAAAKKPKVKGK